MADNLEPVLTDDKVDALSAGEFELSYIDKRGKGLPPNVSPDNVQKHQHVDPQDPGLPRSGDILNKRPEVEKTVEEKAKIAEAEKAEADNKAAEAPPKEEDKAPTEEEKKKETQDTIEKSEFVVYNDPAADAAMNLIRDKGIDATVAAEWFRPVLESGDISKMDTAAMEKALGKTEAALVRTAVTDYYTRQSQTMQKTANAVIETLGGEKNLEALRSWANAITDPKLSAQVAELYGAFNNGEHSARAATKELKSLFESDPNNKAFTSKRVDGDGVDGTAPKILSRSEYLSEMKIAQATGNQARIVELRSNRGQAHKRN